MIKRGVLYFCSCLLLGPITKAAPSLLLFEKCYELNGHIVNRWKCSHSGVVRTQDSCQLIDEHNVPMYFDGCSGSIDGYGDVFINACVRHDLCYHHEPASNGMSKIDCDNQFLKNMLKICRYDRPWDLRCTTIAQSFYSAVSLFGRTSWLCSKEKADYRRVVQSRRSVFAVN